MLLKDIDALPRGTFSVSALKTFPEHRCDPNYLGFTRETDPQHYQFCNHERTGISLFQYTLSGEGRLRFDTTGKTVTLTAGQGFFIPFPSQTTYYLPRGHHWEFIYLCLSGSMARYHAERLVEQYGMVWQMDVSSPPVTLLFDLYRSMLEEKRPDEYNASAIAYQFLMELYQLHRPQPQTLPVELRDVLSFIQKNLHNAELGLDRLAEEAGYSKYHFSRLFKKHVGTTPHAYLLQTRMQKAADLLTQTQQPVKQIGPQVGIPDYPYFCNLFRKHTGLTPGTFRRERQHASIRGA